ncbi:MAG: DUF1015 domain-containing protein [Clostridia bacterium]|nr:DUF1015 domain-containing protein [Clostridia bacterium]
MATIRAFQAVRPVTEKAVEVAALPYDVMSSAEAKEMTKGNALSFLHVDKAEIDLPEGTDLYDDKVYQKAAENLQKLQADGVMRQDEKPCIYIYRQVMNGRVQTGLVCCASADDYLNRVIKKHEFTRAQKEKDRIRHVDTCDANTGPIFLTYRDSKAVNTIVKQYIKDNMPVYNFTSGGVLNVVWVIEDEALIAALINAFRDIPDLYIADGHHRAASAVKVAQLRRAQHPGYTGEEEFNYFLAVLFPESELAIMDYNRVVKDLNGLTQEAFLDKLSEKFTIEPMRDRFKPKKRHEFGLYLGEKWYKMNLKSGICNENNPLERLDVSVLQDHVLSPILGIDDPREDDRIDFIGGIRGLVGLEQRCHEDMCLAFALYPTGTEELMAIADSGNVMPPKSTWFEPKLLSGLFIHKLS